MHMEAGALLGEACPLESDRGVLTLVEAIHLPLSVNGEHVFASSCNVPVQAVFNTPDHMIDQIVDALSFPTTIDQVTQLKSLVTEFPYVIALSDAELGCTGLIRHSIDASDHAPIKQQLYRTPIIRCSLISEMVDNMRKQGIV